MIFQKSNKTAVFALLFILVFQIAVLIIAGCEKKSYHIDEIYTYILSNSYDSDRISHDDNALSTWKNGIYFNKFVTVDANERFAYDKVKYNNGLDAHPPLYYYLVHTVSSFFPGYFGKWIGLGINYALFSAMQLLLFLLVYKITRERLYALVAVSINGSLLAVLDTMLFIRMYALLAFLSVLYVYIHYSIYKNPNRKALYVCSSAVCFLGIYTQYYFAVFAFFTAALCSLWLLKNKKYKTLIFYAVLTLAAVAFVFVLYPAGISQISGSETNNIGNEVSSNILNFSELPIRLLKMGKQIFCNSTATFYNAIPESALCILLTLIASFLLRSKKYGKATGKNSSNLLVGFCILLLLTTISITHISGKFTYIRYVYFLFPLFTVFGILLLDTILPKIPLNPNVVCIGIICLGLLGSSSYISHNLCSYSYEEKNAVQADVIKMSRTRPVIFLSNGATYHYTANFEILRNAKDVYICNYKKEKDIDKILSEKNHENGVIFVVLTDTGWSSGFDGDTVMNEIIKTGNSLKKYENICNLNFSTVYIAK